MPQTVAAKPIKLLDRELASQIAAGEVVERPASVVKELVENSIDAGANSIEIRIEQGGLGCIQVTDNGHGIARADLNRAVAPHATSKIVTVADLDAILTLGFRGEALASISSVSHFSVCSKTHEASRAWRFELSDNTSSTPTPCAHPVGTTVCVRDLFHNTPARRKFLRSEKTEIQHIETVVKHMALSQFAVSIRLHLAGKTRFYPACRDKTHFNARLGQLLGQSFASEAYPIDAVASGLHLWGWLGAPQFSRSQTDLQYFYVNGRSIRDRLVQHAVRSAYQEYLPAGRSPAYVLYLEMAPDEVDVNVHPTKHEVRFKQTRLVYDFIGLHLAQRLVEHNTPQQSTDKTSANLATVPNKPDVADLSKTMQTQSAWMTPATKTTKIPEQTSALGRAVALLDNDLLVCQRGCDLILVDLHSAFACVGAFALEQGVSCKKLTVQPLLVPVRIALNPTQMLLYERFETYFATLYLGLDRLEEGALILRTIPARLKEADLTGIILSMIETLAALSDTLSFDECMQRLIIQLACHCKPGTSLLPNDPLLTALLHELASIDKPATCPHGRKPWVMINHERLVSEVIGRKTSKVVLS